MERKEHLVSVFLFFTLLTVPSFVVRAQNACSPLSRPAVLTGCGGWFSSPGYPSNVQGDTLCQWLIESSAGILGVVILNFDDLDVSTGTVLTIYDGSNNLTSPIIASISGPINQSLGGYATTQRSMLVQFTSTAAGANRGFNATFRSRTFDGACSPSTRPTNITDGVGLLTSPNYPDFYLSSQLCSWLLVSSAGTNGTVKLVFDDFDTESGNDVVTVYDGRTTSSRLIANLSGLIARTTLVQSTQPYLLVQFTTNAALNSVGFSATYTSVITGGECSAQYRPRRLTGDGGTLSSPNFPFSYYGGADCQWILYAAMGPFGVVTLDFTVFNIEQDFDFVYIYDGQDASGALITTLTGNYTTPPAGYTSSIEVMFVRFTSAFGRSYDFATERSFAATYRTTSTRGACSAEYGPARYIEQRGQILSPNYPSNYFSNAACRWLITAQEKYHVVTLFFDYFQTELNADFLRIFDGDNFDAPLLASLTGTGIDLLGPYMSTYQNMFLQFVSNGSNSFGGFSAEYTTTTIVGACSPLYRPYIQNSDFSVLSSPNYPGNYFGNADCRWLIIATEIDGFVSCQFSFLEIHRSDYLLIFDGNNLNERIIVNLTGSFPTPPGPYTTTQRQMLLQFLSDGTNNARGFSGICRNLNSEMGNPCSPQYRPRITSTDGGSLISPQYPRNYTYNVDCQWLLRSPSSDGYVLLNIDFFETQLDKDFLYIYDGNTTSSPLLARLHGSNCIPPDGITSSQPSMLVRFVSDGAVSYRGFSTSFETAYFGDSCSAAFRPRPFSSAFGTFTSPNYPRTYFNNVDCSWLITSDRGPYGVVTLDFTFFETETDADFVYVYNGNSQASRLLERLHGSYKTLPRGITTDQKFMLVRFTTDSMVTAGGFSANYRSTTTEGACSSAIPYALHFGGQFSSPNNTIVYYNNVNCSWLLDSSSVLDGVVRLDFEYFNTELDADFLYIYDGPNANSPLIARLSGTYCNPPPGYTSTQRYMFVRFTSDGDTQFDGFGAKFSSLAYGGACSPQSGPRLLSGNGGLISSPNFPFNYFDNANCQWLIETSNFFCEVIEVDFLYFYTEPEFDYLLLHDGSNQNDSLIVRLSGVYAQPPGDFRSTQQYVLVEFISNGLVTYGGFEARYKSILGNPPPTNRTTVTIPPTTTPIVIPDPCSPEFRPIRLTASNGTFTSANYPSNYTDDARCHWLIISPNATGNVTLEFDDFQTDNCCDLLFVYDGDSRFADLIATMYGSYQQPIPSVSSSQRNMYIVFETNEVISDRGWSARYYT